MLHILIGCEQRTFVKGRHIQYNILLAHELIHKCQRKHIFPRSVMQVAIGKVADSIQWDSVLRSLEGFAFPREFVRLVMACIASLPFLS